MRSNVGVGRGLSLGALLLLTIVSAAAQTQNLPPHLTRPPRTADEAAYRQIQIQRTIEGQQRQAMRDAERNARSSVSFPREPLPKLTEADRKRIAALLTPDPADVAANQELLQQERTGIFRLFPNSNCETKRQIRVDGDCSNHVPGGSSYSFRSGALTPDIHFNNGKLVAEGFFSQMIVTALGDVPLMKAGEASEKIQFLNSFVPAKDFAGAREQRAEILKGVVANGITFSNAVLPKLDMTYVMRIVAYRNGNNLVRRLPPEGLSSDSPVVNFQIVQADNRYDLVVAFRVIRRETDGNVTIVWKELSRKKSPVITFEREEALSDFK